MLQLFFLIACKVFLMFLAFLFNFLVLCIWLYKLLPFFTQTITLCYISPHSLETEELSRTAALCLSFPLCTPSRDGIPNPRRVTGLLLMGLGVVFAHLLIPEL